MSAAKLDLILQMLGLILEMQELHLRKEIIKGAGGLPEEYIDRIVKVLKYLEEIKE